MKVYVLISDWSWDYESENGVAVYANLDEAKAQLKKDYEYYLEYLDADEDGMWNDFEISDDGTHAHICTDGEWARNRNVWDIEEREVL